MQAINLTRFWKVFFWWRPYGYRVLGFFYKGNHYTLFSFKVSELEPKISMQKPRVIDVERSMDEHEAAF